MRPQAEQPISDIDIDIVGSNTFGRVPKISNSQTFNMIISDNWLVQAPGYQRVIFNDGYKHGRGIYSSSRGAFIIAVIDDTVFKISGTVGNLLQQQIFKLNSFFGDVSIDENSASQIAICDGVNLWIYNYITNTPTLAILPTNPDTGLKITPGYVTFHDSYFIVPDTTSNRWYLSKQNDGTVWNWGPASSAVFGVISTKPDNAVAVLRAPGRGNLIYVFGENVVEMYNNVGAQLFPYNRNNSISIDYGCISSNTIAALDDYVCWLGANEKSGPVIMISSGLDSTRLSTDGIDYKLADLFAPQSSYGFMFKLDGHIFYQLTFYDPRDNYTLLYDFNTKKFFYMTDENMNFHIAEAVAFYNNTYYFVSLDDGNVYEMNSYFTTYDYTNPGDTPKSDEFEIPRVRICESKRLDDTSRFIGANLVFPIEQGVDESYKGSILSYISAENGLVLTQEAEPGYVGAFIGTEEVVNPYEPRIDLSISRDGGETFGNTVSQPMNPLGIRSNKVLFWRLGQANEMSVQLRFWSKSRLSVANGTLQTRLAP